MYTVQSRKLRYHQSRKLEIVNQVHWRDVPRSLDPAVLCPASATNLRHIQAFLPNARGHQHIHLPAPELLQHCFLLSLLHPSFLAASGALPNERPGQQHGTALLQGGLNAVHGLAVGGKHDGTSLTERRRSLKGYHV